MENIVYIYGLRCPEKGIIRYVGKSKNPKSRYSAHLSHAKADRYDNIHLYRWIAKLLRNELKPELVILSSCCSDVWPEKEVEWINKFGLENLLNMNEGGIEPPDCTGRVWSDEHKKMFSEQKKGKPQWVDTPHPMEGKFGEDNPNFGQKRSKEFCELMRKQKLENNGMKGKKLPKERVNQLRDINSKMVALLDDNGNIRKKYKSQSEAAQDLELHTSAIGRVCKGEYKHTKGYKFKWV